MCDYLRMETTLKKNRIPTDATFAARLALVRNDMQWNLKEAAIECGFQMNAWANWEAGRQPRSYQDVCEQISKRTGIDLVWLMMGAKPVSSDYKSQPSPSRKAVRAALSRPSNNASRRPGTNRPHTRR